jgi:hypothetical protein
MCIHTSSCRKKYIEMREVREAPLPIEEDEDELRELLRIGNALEKLLSLPHPPKPPQ